VAAGPSRLPAIGLVPVPPATYVTRGRAARLLRIRAHHPPWSGGPGTIRASHGRAKRRDCSVCGTLCRTTRAHSPRKHARAPASIRRAWFQVGARLADAEPHVKRGGVACDLARSAPAGSGVAALGARHRHALGAMAAAGGLRCRRPVLPWRCPRRSRPRWGSGCRRDRPGWRHRPER
jgi:hypothetical protein